MKYIYIISIISSLAFGMCKSDNSSLSEDVKIQFDPENPPKVKFDTLFYDFGSLAQGEVVSHTFKFWNVGKSDLVIFDAFSTCGCTVPKFTKDPIKPGKDGKIEVIFDSAGRRGVQYKVVNVKLNTAYGEKSIGIRANVIENK